MWAHYHRGGRGYSLIGKSVGLNVATVRSKLDLTVVGSNQGAGELYLRCALGKGTLLKIPHSTQVYKWVPALLGSKPATD